MMPRRRNLQSTPADSRDAFQEQTAGGSGATANLIADKQQVARAAAHHPNVCRLSLVAQPPPIPHGSDPSGCTLDTCHCSRSYSNAAPFSAGLSAELARAD